MSWAGHLGLFSEIVDTETGTALGNFPLALTHVSVMHTARHLDLALNLRGRGPVTRSFEGAISVLKPRVAEQRESP